MLDCPKCGASLRVERRGELHDKFLACQHCDFAVDVPDEVMIETEENGRRVRMHRRDVQGATGGAPIDDDRLRSLMDAFTPDTIQALFDAETPGHHGGKTVTKTTVESQVFAGDEAHQKLQSMGLNVDDLLASHVGKQAPAASTSQTPPTAPQQRIWPLVLVAVGLFAVTVGIMLLAVAIYIAA